MKKKKKKFKYGYILRKRKQKPFYKRRWFWFLVLGVIFLAALFYFFFVSPVFRIKQVSFNVEDDLKDDLQGAFLDVLGKPFLFFNSGRAESNILKQLSYLKSIEVKKNLPDKIIIRDAVLRIPLFEFCFVSSSDIFYAENCDFIDETFTEFEPKESSNPPLLLSEFETIRLNELQKIARISDFFNKNIPTEKFFLEMQKHLTVFTEIGFKVYFDLKANDIENKLTMLDVLLESEIPKEKWKTIQYIDMRYSRVFYK